jgi:hypothetical protein
MRRRDFLGIAGAAAVVGAGARRPEPGPRDLAAELAIYRRTLERLRTRHIGLRRLPDVPFFLFGMGPRPKLVYQAGTLRDASGVVVRRWDVAVEKPWYRDGAMVAMVLRETGNLDLIRRWILGLRDPYDRNNAGEAEADNPGQVLFLASLVSDRSHPVVAPSLAALRGFERRTDAGRFIEGRSDFATHPVYQTKWAKHGLRALGLGDPYVVPRVFDPYSALFWWDFRDAHVAGPRFDAEAAQHWPYLVWAEDHFFGTARGLVGERDYPLSWESRAGQAEYGGMAALSPAFVKQKLAVPHTWHAAEMFLVLLGAGVTAPPPPGRDLGEDGRATRRSSYTAGPGRRPSCSADGGSPEPEQTEMCSFSRRTS